MKRTAAFLSCTTLLFAAGLAQASTGDSDGKFRIGDPSKRVQNRYIVVLKEGKRKLRGFAGRFEAIEKTKSLMTTKRGKVRRTFQHALHGFSIEAQEDDARAIAADRNVEYVQADESVQTTAVPWQLDRIDQGALPLNGSYQRNLTGRSVNAYIIDSGILPGHLDFGNRVRLTADFVGDGKVDCLGHGTQVAGALGGATSGVASDVILHSVRVFDCTGVTSWEKIIAAVNWVAQNRIYPAVANLSLAGGGYTPLDTAIDALTTRGVVTVVAAGNANTDVQNVSPARVVSAITVGSSSENDAKSSFSNFGSIVDMFAPGDNVFLPHFVSTSSYASSGGTSFSSPLVAGAVAAFMEGNLHLATESSYIQHVFKSASGFGRLSGLNAATPNVLLNTSETFGWAGRPLFDPVYYFQKNADLANYYGAGNYQGALTHWLQYGRFEGRASSPVYDANFYKTANQDLIAPLAGQGVIGYTSHYVNSGMNEGRTAHLLFDPVLYLEANSDLANGYGLKNYQRAAIHWIEWGVGEARLASLGFDVSFYLQNNLDLIGPFGATGYRAARQHWMDWGIQEGRNASPVFNASYYFTKHTDLRNVYGATNFRAALEHWFAHGIREGRQASAEFNPSYYWNTYADVRGICGGTNNYRCAMRHYLTVGRRAGRKAA